MPWTSGSYPTVVPWTSVLKSYISAFLGFFSNILPLHGHCHLVYEAMTMIFSLSIWCVAKVLLADAGPGQWNGIFDKSLAKY